MLDLVSYLHARRGIITREEIIRAVPGWDRPSDAAERLFFRTMNTLRTSCGMQIGWASEPSGLPGYVVRNRFSSPLLSYASGRSEAPPALASVPESNWNAADCVHVVCGILRTLAMTPRGILLTPTEVAAQRPLSPALLQQFLHRWQARVDLGLDHHTAFQLLWCGSRFRLGTRWPVATAPAAAHSATIRRAA